MILSIQNVSKTYQRGQKKALDSFSAELTAGIYGFLGPNGAGKSTLMNIITGNVRADEGKILYDGADIKQLGKAFRAVLGYMPQQQGLYDEFTANHFLWYMAALKGLSRAESKKRIPELLQLVNLTDSANKKLGSFSGGMKQRILIAQALLNDPEVLILDEPTAGLDPNERIRIRNFISEISLNKIVILATHVVSDVEYIAKEIMLLREGKLILMQRPAEIIDSMRGKVFETHLPSDQLKEFQQINRVSNIVGEADDVRVRFVSDSMQEDENTSAVTPSLEDVYLYHFGDNERYSMQKDD